MTDEQAQTLIDMLPPTARFWVLTVLQAVALLSMVIPLLERVAKLTASTKDDQALTVVQRVLSMFPRVQIPAVSQRPPAPAQQKLEVPNWPVVPSTKADDVSRAVVLPPSPEEPPKG